MRFYPRMTLLTAGFLLATSPVMAETDVKMEQLQVPQCLAAHLSSDYAVIAENKSFKIIDVPTEKLEQIIHVADEVNCGRFINVTHLIDNTNLSVRQKLAQQLLVKPSKKLASTDDTAYPIEHQAEVLAAIQQVKVTNIMATLNRLTTYENRSATKTTGVEAANWLKSSFDTIVARKKRTDTTSFFVKTGNNYKQPSLVTVLGKDIKAPAIVIGAHMDTLDGRMPGAGDDASGSSSLMEVARILIESSYEFKNPIYFVWYAAEERGLVGSQYVVKHFLDKSIPVKAVMQLDMTGFRNNRTDPTMWVFRDYTDRPLTDFVVDLIKTYIAVPVGESRCGYGCSDHASWTKAGFAATFPCETSFERHNPYIHTSKDTVDRLTPEHMVNFSKLGLAFALELALD
ncbi:aminopeptidase [Legionella beliardensis]|uniref:Aminopeptidase n=1 Tax=Legionella beliardensis TaxID=91822 RepID=A0A378HXQ2_9GAMM|nr:M28 family peptidase [Legionella beliardensis]STX27602.1 aminopeptidase [Legionella beliardensis]